VTLRLHAIALRGKVELAPIARLFEKNAKAHEADEDGKHRPLFQLEIGFYRDEHV